MSIAERVGRMMNRVYDAVRHKKAFELRPEDAVEGSLEPLRGSSYAVMVTFRRNGTPVPTPIWFGLDGAGRAYVRTFHDAGKVKRIRNDPRVLISASTMRGKPKGTLFAATGRVLPEDEWEHAEKSIAAAYGLMRKVYEGVLDDDSVITYVEISPVTVPAESSFPEPRVEAPVSES